jgi:crossover junction endodeoxyribonuclease RuvC
MSSNLQNFSILGVDPGSRVTGFGLVRVVHGHIEHVSHGVIVMDSQGDFSDRMLELGTAFRQLMEK